ERNGSSASICCANCSSAEKFIEPQITRISRIHRKERCVQQFPYPCHPRFDSLGELHEFDGRSIRITHIDDALTGIRTNGERLRFAGHLPAKGRDALEDIVEIVDEQRDM